MKKLLVLAILIFAPISSYAIVDFEGYAGYNFLGKFDPANGSGNVSGLNLGGRAHLTLDLVLLNFGIGAFADYRPLSYELNGDQVKFDRFSTGPDMFLKLDIPLVPIKPYLRGGFSIYDRYQQEVNNTTTKDIYYLKGYYFGGGASYTLLSLLLVDVQLFGEYLFDYSKLEDSQTLKSHRVNFGITLAM